MIDKDAVVTMASWAMVMGDSYDVEQYIEVSLGSYTADFDLKAFARAFRAEINEELPAGAFLVGDEFKVPASKRSEYTIGHLIDAVQNINFWEFAEKFANA